MLTLLLGRAKSGKTQRLLDKVQACPAVGMAQRILIVPEQLSHQTERTLSQLCGDSISYVSEVLSFTRLASRVCAIHGGGARQSLDQGGRILTARLALSSIHAQLKVFAPVAGRADFLGSMVDIIDELKTYGVTPGQLMDASAKTEGMFAQKLSELGMILGAYDAVMAQNVCDPRDKLTLLNQKLFSEDYAEHRHFFVDGFTDFSQQELNILETILRRSGNLTVTLPCDSLEGGEEFFQPGRETAQRMIRMAEAMGQAVNIEYADYRRPIAPELRFLEENLYRYGAPAYTEHCEAVTLVPASDRLAECRHCAAVLRQSAMAGIRWRDMAVVAGDTEAYGPLMEAVAREMDIPLYTGVKAPVTAHPAVAFVLLALEAATEGMETETVVAYLRTGYSGVDADACDALENYACTWAIRGSRWQKPWTEHPEGYDGRFTEETEQQLEELNALRDTAISPLLRLSARLKAAGNTRGQIEAVYRFLEDTGLYDQVSGQIEDLAASGKQEAAQESAQVFNTLMECFQQTVSVLGQTAQNSRDFLQILRLALGQYALSTIPATLDSVSFGAIDSVRGSGPKLLYVLGVNAGLLPQTTGGGSLLTERERKILLRDLNIALAPDSEGALKRELLQIYSTFTAPKERLYVSYALRESGEELQPSFLVERLNTLFPEMQTETAPQGAADAMTPGNLAELFFVARDQGEQTLEALIRRIMQQAPDLEQLVIDAESASLPRELQVSRELSARLFGTPVNLTASRLDALGNCPLSFFLNYGLKARVRKEASFDAAEYGTFLHYILEKTVDDVTREQRTLPISPEESGALVRGYMEPYLEERMQNMEHLTARQQYLYHRNQTEAAELLTEISKEFAASSFRPVAFELTFGGGKDLPALLVQGNEGSGHLDGMVDRADLWHGPNGDYLRIVDYKSGTKKFDYTDLTAGVGMQMLLYLFALEQSGISDVTEHPIPAGALYFPAKRGVLTVDEPVEDEQDLETLRRKKEPGRSGLVLDDDAVLEAMEAGQEGRYIPTQKKKDGHGDYAISREQMDLLKTFIQKQMGRAVDRITTGDFAPAPFYRGQSHDPCRWCDYGDICQKDQKFRQEHYVPPVKAVDFWKKIGGEGDG